MTSHMSNTTLNDAQLRTSGGTRICVNGSGSAAMCQRRYTTHAPLRSRTLQTTRRVWTAAAQPFADAMATHTISWSLFDRMLRKIQRELREDREDANGTATESHVVFAVQVRSGDCE
eukprot:1444822-Rhodomonas_salina.1